MLERRGRATKRGCAWTSLLICSRMSSQRRGGRAARSLLARLRGCWGRTMHGKNEAPLIEEFIIGCQLDQTDPRSRAALLVPTPAFPDLRR